MYKNVIVHPHGFVVLQGTRNKNAISPHLKTKELDSISCWHTRPQIYFTINITRYFWFNIAGTQKLFQSKVWEQFTYDHQSNPNYSNKINFWLLYKCPHSRKWWILGMYTNFYQHYSLHLGLGVYVAVAAVEGKGYTMEEQQESHQRDHIHHMP